MNCKEFDDKISLYIDGKLNKDEEEAFLDHSNHCQRCQKSLENTRQMIGSLEDLRYMKAPKDLSKSIIQTLEMEMKNFGSEDPQESTEDSLEENVQQDEQDNVRKIGQSKTDRNNRKDWFLKQGPWIKKISLAAVLVLIVTSAVILTTDWFPAPRENDMMVMESGEESTLAERAADESEDDSDSIDSGESSDQEEGPGITAMEDEEKAFGEEPSFEEGLGEEGLDGEVPDMDETQESEDGDTFGIKYGEWIVLLLGIGVISVIVVLRKNRK